MDPPERFRVHHGLVGGHPEGDAACVCRASLCVPAQLRHSWWCCCCRPTQAQALILQQLSQALTEVRGRARVPPVARPATPHLSTRTPWSLFELVCCWWCTPWVLPAGVGLGLCGSPFAEVTRAVFQAVHHQPVGHAGLQTEELFAELHTGRGGVLQADGGDDYVHPSAVGLAAPGCGSFLPSAHAHTSCIV